MRAQYGESVLGVYDYFSSAFGPTNIGNGGARPISYYSDYWIDGFAQVDAEDTFWEERLLTDTDLSELGTDGIIISSYMFDCIRYYKLYENAPYRKEYELNDYNDVVGKPLKFNARDGTNVTLTIRGVFRADLPAEYEPLKDYSLNTYNPEMRALASRLDVEMEYGIYNLALVSDRTANIRSVLRGTDSPMTRSTNLSLSPRHPPTARCARCCAARRGSTRTTAFIWCAPSFQTNSTRWRASWKFLNLPSCLRGS